MEKKILIIDDEKNIRMTLEKALAKAGFTVSTAVNGEDGLQKINDTNYPVILLDMKMPGMGGMEFLKQIRDLDYQTRVVMITGFGNVETAVEAMKLGAVDFLRKPFKPTEIIELVEEVYARYELEENSDSVEGFSDHLNLAKSTINKRNFEEARNLLKKATSINPEKPEPFNLLGIIHELKHNQAEAMKMYRAALAIDPAYSPATENLQRAGESMGKIDLEKINMGDEEV